MKANDINCIFIAFDFQTIITNATIFKLENKWQTVERVYYSLDTFEWTVLFIVTTNNKMYLSLITILVLKL